MSIAIVWFRRDLRLVDNPALERAIQSHDTIVPLYIHAPHEDAPWLPGGASRWWLDRSLASLDADLRQRGARLILRSGGALESLRTVIRESGACALFWNRLYEPRTKARDTHIKAQLRADGIDVWSGNAGLLFEPWSVQTAAGQPYRVFTAFWKACRPRLEVALSAPALDALDTTPNDLHSAERAELGLQPDYPWDSGLRSSWTPGEAGAIRQLERFTTEGLGDYSSGRDYPARPATSRLSPHLHFGEISPRQVAAAALARSVLQPGSENAVEKFLSELGWREFAYHLLFHFPELPEHPLNTRFGAFAWRDDGQTELRAWQRGRTGIPLVDAGMRELWATGWMHNRVRMIVGSFLTKNLRIPWQQGAAWFWDTLVDADLANNSFGWQWIAGCGADAAPFFRIFNPVTQGAKFDASGAYVRRWVPELGALPNEHLHAPWQCTPKLLAAAGVRLGDTYPEPLIDLKASREQALSAYQAIKISP